MPFMGYLKQSTQVTKTVLLVDSTDHVTGKTGLTITKYLTKAGGTPTSATMTTSELDSTNAKGIYSLVFTTTHTDTLGDFQLHLSGTGADPADYWWTVVARSFDDLAYPATSGRSMVVDANGLVDANAVKVGPTGSGTAQTARDIGASVLLSSGTGTGQISLSSGAVTIGTNNDKTGYTASTVSDKTGYSLSSGGVQAIWDALTSALTTVGSIGKLLVDNINASIAAVKAKTDNLPTDPADESLLEAAITAATSGLSTLDAAGVRSAVGLASANLDTQLSTISGYVDTEVAAIKAKTDQLTFTVAGEVDANIQAVNDVTVNGNGTTVPWGP